jgi:hypothetical protein
MLVTVFGWSARGSRGRMGLLMKVRRVAKFGAAVAVAAGIGTGCAGSGAGPKAATGTGPVARDTRIQHEDCALDDSGAVAEDINGDGRPDRTSLSDGGRVSCRGLDFNFDGLIDAWVYLDESGQVRRRESDYDRDGRVDEVALYQAGILTERQRATTLAGKLDTWQHYRNGKVASAERDSNGDDYVDQWWEYPEQRPPECPLIHSDVNGDGRPDPGATVDVCKDRYVPASRDGSKPGADPAEGDPALEEVPTELEQAPDATPTEQQTNTPGAAPATGEGTQP